MKQFIFKIEILCKLATTDQEKCNLFADRLEKLHQIRDDDTFNANWRETVENHVRNTESSFKVDKSCAYSETETGDETPIMSQITKEEVITHLKRCKNNLTKVYLHIFFHKKLCVLRNQSLFHDTL